MIKPHTFECLLLNIGDMRADFHQCNVCNMRKYIDRDICLTEEMIISTKKAIDYRFRYKLPSYPKNDVTCVYHAQGPVLQML